MDIPKCALCGDATQTLKEGGGYSLFVCATCDKYKIDGDVLLELRAGRRLDASAMSKWLESKRLEGIPIPMVTLADAKWLT